MHSLIGMFSYITMMINFSTFNSDAVFTSFTYCSFSSFVSWAMNTLYSISPPPPHSVGSGITVDLSRLFSLLSSWRSSQSFFDFDDINILEEDSPSPPLKIEHFSFCGWCFLGVRFRFALQAKILHRWCVLPWRACLEAWGVGWVLSQVQTEYTSISRGSFQFMDSCPERQPGTWFRGQMCGARHLGGNTGLSWGTPKGQSSSPRIKAPSPEGQSPPRIRGPRRKGQSPLT